MGTLFYFEASKMAKKCAKMCKKNVQKCANPKNRPKRQKMCKNDKNTWNKMKCT